MCARQGTGDTWSVKPTVSDVEIPWRAETTREQQEIERGLSLAGENEQGIQTREESSVT